MNYIQSELCTILKEAARSLNSPSWQPEIIHNSKRIPKSTLSQVDFAIPLHSLAQTNGMSSQEVAERVVTNLREQAKNHFAYEVEELDGYINFEIEEEELNKRMIPLKKWFQSPKIKTFDPLIRRVIVMGGPLLHCRENYGDNFASFLLKLTRTVTVAGRIDYLLDDSSNDLILPLWEALLQNNAYTCTKSGELTLKQLKMQLVAPESQRPKYIKDYLAEKSKQRIQSLSYKESSKEEDGFHIVMTSQISSDVQAFLNTLDGPYIYKDKRSEAVFFNTNAANLPLRTSMGILCQGAYLLYWTWKALAALGKKGGVIVVAPKETKEIMEVLLGKADSKPKLNIFESDVPDRAMRQVVMSQTDIGALILAAKTKLGGKSQDQLTHSTKIELLSFPCVFERCIKNFELGKLVKSVEDLNSKLLS